MHHVQQLPTPPASPQLHGLCGSDDRIGQVLAGRIQLTDILGVGAYGTVYRARDVETNVEYAVKALNKAGLEPRQKQFQDREIKLHYKASQHPNVVSMVKILDSPDCTFVVLEYCPEGDLFAKITDEGHYTGDDNKARCAFLQIVDAVQHCHAHGIYHRDLKPENILVKDNGWTVKLADFGLATEDRVTSDFGCGSTFYMSPECQQANPRPFSCYQSAPNDVWSLGVILVNLTCGRNPWKRACLEDSTFKAFVQDRNFLRTILPISDELNFILQRIFELDPRRRITLPELRNLIACCPRLTAQEVSSTPALPITPPYSPVSQVADASMQVQTADVPPMEPLPAMQYPSTAPPGVTVVRHGLLTPSDSPQLPPHTFGSKPAPAGLPFVPAASPGYLQAFPTAWQRCVPTFHLRRPPACFWNSVPVY